MDNVETAIYRLKVEGQAEIDRLTKSIEGMTIAEEKATTANRTFSQSLQNNVARIDPVIKAQEQYRKALETNARYRESGVGTEQQLNAQLAAATQRYQSQTSAVSGLAEAHKGLNAQGQAAFHSLRSMVEVIAMGGSPIQALTGQMNHLTFAASGEGGIVGAFKQVGGLLGGMLSPMTATVAGLGAIAAAAAAVAMQFDKVQVSSQRAIGGAGSATGTTVSDLNAFVQKNASVSTSGLSDKEVRSLGEEFTKTGEIVIGQLHGMSDAIMGFANQTGKSVTEANKAFVEFGKDPMKALKELEAVWGTFDKSVRDSVETFTLAGDKTAALNVLIDAQAEKAKKAAENMGVLEKMWRGITTFAGLETAKPSGTENQLEIVRKKLNTAIESAPDMLNTAEASQNIERLSREFEKLQEAREKAIGETATAQLNKLNTESERHREQVAAIAKSWGDVGTATALALNALQQQVAVAQAVTGRQQQAAQYAADFANASLEGKTAIEAEAIASAKLAVSQASATSAVEKQTASLKDQTAMIIAHQNGTEAVTAAAIAYKNAIESGADSTAAAALQAETLKNHLAQAGIFATTFGEQMQNAAQSMQSFSQGMGQSLAAAMEMQRRSSGGNTSASEAGYMYSGGVAGTPHSQFDPSVMPKGPLGFAGFINRGDENVYNILKMQAQEESGGIASLVDTAYKAGGITGALAAIRAAPNSSGISDIDAQVLYGGNPNINAVGILGPRGR